MISTKLTETEREGRTSTRRPVRKLAAAVVLAATAAIAGGTGYALHTQAGSPAGCAVAGHTLPSGDAMKVDSQGNAWTEDSKVPGPVSTFVCTDGTWVHVTGYGSTGQAVTTAHTTGGPYAADDATCKASAAYVKHPTAKRFRVMVKDSSTAFWFLRMDVAWWAKDRKQHADRAELAQDRVMVAGDCSDPAAQQDS